MSRPSKPHDLIVLEGKSHRTKAELSQRKQAESELLTGTHMKCWPEVKAEPDAEKEFRRVRNLLKKIEKDDALYEGAVNRYAMMKAECTYLEGMKNQLRDDIQETIAAFKREEVDFLTYKQMVQKDQAAIIAADKQIQTKRKMLLDIEREMALTLAAALRSIPKKAQKKEEPTGMAKFINNRNGSSG